MEETIVKNAQIATEEANTNEHQHQAPAEAMAAPVTVTETATAAATEDAKPANPVAGKPFDVVLARAVETVKGLDVSKPTAMNIIGQLKGFVTGHPAYDAAKSVEFLMLVTDKTLAAVEAAQKRAAEEAEKAKTEKPVIEVKKPDAPKAQAVKNAEQKNAEQKKTEKKQSEKKSSSKKMSKSEEEKAENARKRQEEWAKKLEERKKTEAEENEKLAKAFVASEDVVKALQEVRNVKESKGGEWKAMSLLAFINHLADIDQLTYWKVQGKDGKSTYYKANGMWITKEAYEYANSLKHGGSRIEA